MMTLLVNAVLVLVIIGWFALLRDPLPPTKPPSILEK